MNVPSFLIWLLPSILSFITVWIIYRIYLFNKQNKSWFLIAWGFFLIVLLRVLTLLYAEGLFPNFFALWYIYDPVLRMLNNLCFILGFLSMIKNFKIFDSVESKVRRITKRMGAKKK